MIQLKPLPYAYNALEPVISEKTLKFHYDKHHKGYVDKLITLLGRDNFKLSDILANYTDNKVIWNNAAQHHHHEFYWESLTPVKCQNIQDTLQEIICKTFETVQNFLDKIHANCVGLFGSGWVWITMDKNNTIHIESTSNADFPQYHPLLVLDVWEHSYYLDYQNNRSAHIKALVEHLNWEKAYERFKQM